MPNIKSAMKRDEKSKLQNLKNKATVTQPSVPIKLLSRLLTARPARV